MTIERSWHVNVLGELVLKRRKAGSSSGQVISDPRASLTDGVLDDGLEQTEVRSEGGEVVLGAQRVLSLCLQFLNTGDISNEKVAVVICAALIPRRRPEALSEDRRSSLGRRRSKARCYTLDMVVL